MQCRICHNSEDNIIYNIREMMFGFRDEFEYFQCSQCNCLQLSHFPKNILKYYPDNYYSFSPVTQIATIRPFWDKMRYNYLLFRKGVLGKYFYNKYPFDDPLFLNQIYLLQQIYLTKKTRILDVGCGQGEFLYNLAKSSLKTLLGIDPFIAEDIIHNKKLKILKKDISEVGGHWDIVMFHHSFEHIPNPEETLQAVSRLLSNGGVCLLRIPIVPSFAWEHYKENWVQLDAPRHFFLHSQESIRILSEKANLTLKKIIYDSNIFQFIGSELYLRDIPLQHNHPFNIKSMFSEADIKMYSDEAERLNKERKGDQAAFYLIKKEK
ncbi:MAG: class I SAM-dependent methyltransferase [Thermodesulfobacteriota bacterium]